MIHSKLQGRRVRWSVGLFGALVALPAASLSASGFAASVRDFGAAGDGVTDDTVAFRAALAGGGEVLVPGPGTYVVAPSGAGAVLPITVSGTTLRCTGGATIKLRNGSLVGGAPGRLVANADATGAVVRVRNVTIAGCTFDGNDAGNPDPQSPFAPELITCISCTDLVIRDNHLEDVTFAGIGTYFGSAIRITDNRMFRLGQTVTADAIQVNGGQHVMITGNVIENAGEGIFFQHATGSRPVKAQGGVIGHNLIAQYAANEICLSNGLPYTCCTSLQAGSGTGPCAAGRAGGSAIGVLAEGVTVVGNTVRNANVVSVQSGRGFPTTHVTVVGNTILNSAGSGILVQPIDGIQSLTHVQIVGNHVAGTASGGSGLEIASRAPVGTRDITVTDNVLLGHCVGGGTSCAGIYLHDLGGAGFADVELRGNRIADGNGVGVRIEGPATNVRLQANQVDRNAAGTYAVSAAILVDGLPLTDAPKSCGRDRNGQRYRDLSLDEECVCNSHFPSGARWCQTDGGGCGTSGGCG